MATTTFKKPQYKDLKFTTETAFNKWLNQTATRKIEFADQGQDLQTIWIDDAGEILHSNLQTSVWCGKFISMETLEVGQPLQMWLGDGKHAGYKTMDFMVDVIEPLKK